MCSPDLVVHAGGTTASQQEEEMEADQLLFGVLLLINADPQSFGALNKNSSMQQNLVIMTT